jgi:hypothetical protein
MSERAYAEYWEGGSPTRRSEAKREMNGNAESVRLMFQEVLLYALDAMRRAGTGTTGQGQVASRREQLNLSVTRVIMEIPVDDLARGLPKARRGATTYGQSQNEPSRLF